MYPFGICIVCLKRPHFSPVVVIQNDSESCRHFELLIKLAHLSMEEKNQCSNSITNSGVTEGI